MSEHDISDERRLREQLIHSERLSAVGQGKKAELAGHKRRLCLFFSPHRPGSSRIAVTKTVKCPRHAEGVASVVGLFGEEIVDNFHGGSGVATLDGQEEASVFGQQLYAVSIH